MSHKIESHACPQCSADTPHVVILVRKTSPYKDDKKRDWKEFFSGFVKGAVLGAFIASMDEFERHLVCEQCGHKIIEE
ncbi:hypothetical protein KZY45_001978 [Vibrio vulnificus]|uniref:hypothetical protein n=1 Tax=Vibrio vulnificus TaxID=672 RepID=UPI0028A2DF9D|nr:hypothetical protein [Vibrio vulnificus]HDY7718593.1 hypothetical protein [Vibrio vulnificus]HDY7745943.1 hypothetical protein [Vibrio vulnificus]HDY7754910.1 hypothetical protein [Vibrio vulnificus]HDY7759955.1 hypothetical protein [Vibrio vulnificus]